MKEVNFSDWQEMALKKDVEQIKKKIYSQEPIFFSLCWELILVLGSNYICLFNYLFISSQMSAKPYFIGSTGILPLW